MEEELVCKCGGKMFQEDRKEQYERIKKGLGEILTNDSEEKIEEYTRNFIGYGPNYMYKCELCGRFIKFIPDGRKRNYD